MQVYIDLHFKNIEKVQQTYENKSSLEMHADMRYYEYNICTKNVVYQYSCQEANENPWLASFTH